MTRSAARVSKAAGTLVLAASVALFAAVAVLPHLGLYRTVTVLSQSMRPTFSAGDVVVVTPERTQDVHVGQVITYRVPIGDHWVESHRVVRVLEQGMHPVVQTRGDANNADDPWTARLDGTTAWHVRAVIPYAGWIVIALRSAVVHVLSLFVAPLLLACVGIARIWRCDRKPVVA